MGNLIHVEIDQQRQTLYQLLDSGASMQDIQILELSQSLDKLILPATIQIMEQNGK